VLLFVGSSPQGDTMELGLKIEEGQPFALCPSSGRTLALPVKATLNPKP